MSVDDRIRQSIRNLLQAADRQPIYEEFVDTLEALGKLHNLIYEDRSTDEIVDTAIETIKWVKAIVERATGCEDGGEEDEDDGFEGLCESLEGLTGVMRELHNLISLKTTVPKSASPIKRKFVQLHSTDHTLYGLASDGSVWLYRGQMSRWVSTPASTAGAGKMVEEVIEPAGWHKMPDLPEED